MKRNHLEQIKSLIRFIEALVEVLVLSFVYRIVFGTYDDALFAAYPGRHDVLLVFMYAFVLTVVFALNDSFRFGRLKLAHIFVSQTIAVILSDIIIYLQLCLLSVRMAPLKQLFILIISDVALCFVFTYLYTAIYHMIYVPSNILMVIGDDAVNVDSLRFKVAERADKYTITKIIKISEGQEKIAEELNGHDALIIYDVPAPDKIALLKYCYAHAIRTYLVPTISDILIKGADDITLFDTPLLLMRGYGFNSLQKLYKRLMDVVMSSVGLIVFGPLLLVIALAIKLEDGGPVFFRQDRITRDEKVFSILKFRSMVTDADKNGSYVPAADNDPRITRVGRIIRPLRLDELPQLFNILKGDMSIVGPRPERVELVREYESQLPEFSYRHKVKAGLTGYAQIYGKYNTSAYDKLRMDLIYIENYTALLDIKLIVETIRVLFKKDATEGFK